jgi:hypothetical protein
MDITAISTILSSVKTATEIAKFLKESDLTLAKAETKLKLADLIVALADVKMEVAGLQGLLLDKDEQIRQLQEELKVKGNLVFEHPYYWLETEEERKGPFCPSCKCDKGKLSDLLEDRRGRWRCCVCGKVFFDKNYTEPDPVATNWRAFT